MLGSLVASMHITLLLSETCQSAREGFKESSMHERHFALGFGACYKALGATIDDQRVCATILPTSWVHNLKESKSAVNSVLENGSSSNIR
jgi:hypothetical protein